jgi:cytochrome c553
MLTSLAALVCTAAAGATDPQQATSEQTVVMRLREHADINHGRELFNTCAACHQSNGAGAVDGSVPAIAGQHYGFLVHELVSFRHEQRQDERMQHFTDQHHLKDAQAIADVAAYISQLPKTHSSNHGSGEALQAGARHYADTCASCHGATGDGNAQHDVPRIAGQQYQYLLHVLLNPADEVRPDFWSVHARVLNGLQRSDLIAIADYVSRLNP